MGPAAVDPHKGIFGWCANSPKGSQPLNCRTTRCTRWQGTTDLAENLSSFGAKGLRVQGHLSSFGAMGASWASRREDLAIEHFGR